MATLRPCEDRVLVKPDPHEETTDSGLIIPGTAQDKPVTGEVLAVGPGRYDNGELVPPEIHVGDTVVYSKYGGTETKALGEELLLMRAGDVLAVVEP